MSVCVACFRLPEGLPRLLLPCCLLFLLNFVIFHKVISCPQRRSIFGTFPRGQILQDEANTLPETKKLNPKLSEEVVNKNDLGSGFS